MLNTGMAQLMIVDQAASAKARKAIEEKTSESGRLPHSGALDVLKDIDLTS